MELEIRPILEEDLPILSSMDHSFHTDYVWQMSMEEDEHSTSTKFREVRLPRSMRVDYPWPEFDFLEGLGSSESVLVAVHEDQPVGYIRIIQNRSRTAATVVDLVVNRRLRRQGIGTALLQAASAWMKKQGISLLQLEMQSKNHPGIKLANKLGFEFCGFSDRYFPNFEIALFFMKKVQ